MNTETSNDFMYTYTVGYDITGMMYIVLCSMLYRITLSQGIQDYNSELVNNYVHNYVTNV